MRPPKRSRSLGPRLRITLAIGVLLGGAAGAYLFRKPKAAVTRPARASLALEQRPATPASPSPGPVASHLLGRIDALSVAQTQATPPLQPTASDPEIRADQAVGETNVPGATMPAAPPWAEPGDANSVQARAASLSSNAGFDQSAGALRSPPEGRPLRTHRVVDGDTLAKLAGRYLGGPERSYEIFEANRDVLRSPDELPIGVLLKIPDPASRPQVAAPGPMVDIPPEQLKAARQQQWQAAAAPAAPKNYRVQAGDTLATISQQLYGDAGRYGEIVEANRDKLSRPEDLREGMTLVIP
jgi:nucleoid-associated protein YgaU